MLRQQRGQSGQQREGHGCRSHLQKAPRTHGNLLPANGEQPEDRCQRTRDRKIGAKIDANQNRVAEQAPKVHRLHRCARHKS